MCGWFICLPINWKTYRHNCNILRTYRVTISQRLTQPSATQPYWGLTLPLNDFFLLWDKNVKYKKKKRPSQCPSGPWLQSVTTAISTYSLKLDTKYPPAPRAPVYAYWFFPLLRPELMELSPSWEAANCAATQEIPRILWNPEHIVHKNNNK
jgi:hypothetical protein